MKIPDKYKVNKIRFDKALAEKINCNEIIADRLYSLVVLWILYSLGVIPPEESKEVFLFMFMFVILNIIFGKNLNKLKTSNLKIIIYAILNLLPLLYFGKLLTNNSYIILLFSGGTYLLTYCAFYSDSKIVISKSLQLMIQKLVVIAIIVIVLNYSDNLYILELIFYCLMCSIVFTSFLEIKFIK